MYRRFLNNNDYISIVTEEALAQLIRGNEERLAQAEEAAEQSVVEYLTDNYEIERELEIGKMLRAYNGQITYPAGAHFYYDDKIYRAIRPINSRKAPMTNPYWEEITDYLENNSVEPYSQQKDYSPGDIVAIGRIFYRCLQYNGVSYQDIRYPGINAWEEKEALVWYANQDYNVWDVVEFNGNFYTLVSKDDIDLTLNPYLSDNWGMIGNYQPDLEYEFVNTEYVVYNGHVFFPVMNPNGDKLEESYNITPGDPRNPNLKKHILRLAVYELFKLISPNNISSARITDYETSITWLRDASRLKINPHIPRKLDEEKKAVTEYAIATYARDYDPNKNPWQV